MTQQATTLPNSTNQISPRLFFSWWIPSTISVVGLMVLSSAADPYLAYVATSWIIFGLVGLSLDLVWGRAGILSLGQTALYGLGGYAGSIAAINFAPMTGNSLMWSLPFGALTGVIAAAIIGWFIFFGRVGPLQTTIVSYAVILILWTLSKSFSTQIGDAFVGGDNGMSNIPAFVLGFGNSAEALEPNAMFLTTITIAATLYFIAQMVARSPFGLVIDCIRLDQEKVELLGYDIRRYKLLLFMLSGAIAGIAGALFGAWSNYLNPSIFSIQEALLIPIYVLVGGLGTLAGPFIGALAIGGLSFWLGGGVVGGQTTLIMGTILILLVLFLRKGLLSGIQSLIAKRIKQAKAKNVSDDHLLDIEINFDLLHTLHEHLTRHEGMTLETKDALKSFGGVTPVNQITQSFSPGKVRCIIGPNGAGKSSYLKICTGAYKPDAGQVILDGRDITTVEPHQRVKLGLGIKMQKAQVFDELSVERNLWVAAYSCTRSKSRADQVSRDMLKMLGMVRHTNRPASELSHGEQQWLDIAMVLCMAPDVILLDEPAAGMTKKERRQLSDLIKALAETSAVVVVDHDMDFIRTLEAEVTVLHQGAVFAQGDIEDLRKDERILDIYLGRKENFRDI